MDLHEEIRSREEGEIGSESREKGDLLPCSSPLLKLRPHTFQSTLSLLLIHIECQHSVNTHPNKQTNKQVKYQQHELKHTVHTEQQLACLTN